MKYLIEEPYQIPPGMQDFPFAYVYDGSNLVDGAASIQNNVIQIDADSDFILRHIAGVPTCIDTPANGGRFSYRNASGSYANGNPSTGIAFPNNWPVVPEKRYPANHQISFDLYQTLRSFNVCGETPIYNAQIAFMGVKRVPKGGAYRGHESSYRYRERNYTYSQTQEINFAHFTAAGALTGPLRFSVQLDSYDFELLAIRITPANLGANPPTGQAGTLTTNDFQLTLYDAQYHATSGGGVGGTRAIGLNQAFLNAGYISAFAAVGTAPQFVWPVPTLVYPAGGQILYDITSMLCSGQLPIYYNIAFEGIWRIPC